jgi:hypothetical protein
MSFIAENGNEVEYGKKGFSRNAFAKGIERRNYMEIFTFCSRMIELIFSFHI